MEIVRINRLKIENSARKRRAREIPCDSRR